MIDEKRICREFEELVKIDSPSFGEKQMAECLKRKLQELGFEITETENIYGFLKGTLPGGPILLSAHMDTVEPSGGKQAVFHADGTITSGGDTVLGADDAAGIVEILEAVRHIQEEKLPHRDIEILFSAAEEVYIKGIKQQDRSQIRAKEAYVLDMSGAPGAAALKAPSLISFTVTLHGRAAHAGFAPEQGIHAIGLMSRAISRIPQGHIDADTTLNIGRIEGGTATNIIPDRCVCRGEIRSYSHEKALACVEMIRNRFREAVEGPASTFSTEKAQGPAARFDLETTVDLQAYEISPHEPVVKRFQKACSKAGLPCELTATFGGSDNNWFVQQGIRGIVLSCGFHEPHSVREYTTVSDLKQGSALVAAILLCEMQ